VVTNSDLFEDMESITLNELLERSAASALKLQRKDGSFPSGRNYTYNEPETPVGTTSHWAVTLAEVYDITGEDKYKKAGEAAVDYLLNKESRPYGYTYHCRDAPRKDQCNGLIGQAYPIRALAHTGPILGRQDAIKIAQEVFMCHPFDEKIGLWEQVEIDGKKLSFDRTLNHQILFAAGSCKLASEYDIVADRITTFLDRLPSNMELHPNGIIKHYIRPSPICTIKTTFRELRHWPLLLNEAVIHYYSRNNERRKKEIGYQPVNLRGLAQLRVQFSEHDIWSDPRIQSSITYSSESMYNCIEYGSIVPGIDLGWADYAFSRDMKKVKYNIKRELENSLNTDNYLLQSDNIEDMNKSAVISLLVGIPDIEMKLCL